MKMIIDLPNEAYKILTKYQVLPENIDIEYFVIHGTPLEEELEKIKAEMDNKGWYNRHDKEQFAEIVDNHIAELKGE